MTKPITIARKEYIEKITNITNTSELPAFAIIEVLKEVIRQMRPIEENQLKRDEAMYRKALADENKKSEVNQNGENRQLSEGE